MTRFEKRRTLAAFPYYSEQYANNIFLKYLLTGQKISATWKSKVEDVLMEGYRKQDIAAKLGKKSFAGVQSWVDQGIIVPEIIRGGPGVTRVYSQKNLLEFVLVDRLLGCGVRLHVIKQVFDQIRSGVDNAGVSIETFFTDNAWGTEYDLVLHYDLEDKTFGGLYVTEPSARTNKERYESPAVALIYLGRTIVAAKKEVGVV